MEIEIRGLKVGESSVGGWMFSKNLFNSVSKVNEGDSTKESDSKNGVSIGLTYPSIWYR